MYSTSDTVEDTPELERETGIALKNVNVETGLFFESRIMTLISCSPRG